MAVRLMVVGNVHGRRKKMTRDEAIEMLKKLRTFHNGTYANAIDMAIDALSIVRCKDCKHRPHLKNEDGADYGFNVVDDDGTSFGICPCLCEDGWYSWMPKDDFFCAWAERRE